MKRILPAVLGLLLLTGISTAQTSQMFTQRGNATQGKFVDGMFADHPSLPIGSKAIIINTLNNLEIEVTIAGRIPASTERIIDLSPEAAAFIGLISNGEVIVSVPVIHSPDFVSLTEPDIPPGAVIAGSGSASAVLPEPELMDDGMAPPPVETELPVETADAAEISAAAAEDEIAAEPIEEVEITAEPIAEPVPVVPPAAPVNLTVYGYFFSPENLALEGKPDEMDYLEWLAMMALKSSEANKMREQQKEEAAKNAEAVPNVEISSPEVPEILHVPAVPQAEPQKVQAPRYVPPVEEIRVMPGLPEPNSGKIYRLQVGAFSNPNAARDAVSKMRAAGFDTVQEQAGSLQRVMAAGVPAEIVYYAVKRLEALGFTDVWIKE